MGDTHDWILSGAHRGGASIARALTQRAVAALGDRVAVADPREGRALFLGEGLRRRFGGLAVRAETRLGEELLPSLARGGVMVLASDTPQSLGAALTRRAPSQRATWQIAGRGPGGAGAGVFALRGTVLPGDDGAELASRALLTALGAIAPSASSRAMTDDDPLGAAVLAPLRAQSAAQTAAHLGTLDRAPWELEGGALSMIQWDEPHPLAVISASPDDPWRRRRELALAGVASIDRAQWTDGNALGRFAVVAVVVSDVPRVDFITLRATRSDRRALAGLMTLDVPPAPTPTTRAVLTD